MNISRAKFLAEGHGKTGPWVDLVNSEEWNTFAQRTDHLNDSAWIPYFLRQWRFAKPPGSAAPIEKLKSLRATLRKSCEALSTGKPIPPAEMRTLNQTLNVAGKQRLLQRQNGLRIEFVPTDCGWDWILAETVHSFADTLGSGEAERIKICRNSDCGWVFYDRTKGKTRCWCSDKSCGNRERVRRARARTKRS
jgi:predicted RNA-binding Zn ribbon-like protein